MPSDPMLRATALQALAVTMVDERASHIPDQRAFPLDESGPDGRGPSILPEPGQLIAGLYRLGRLLGEGMFGKVYLAQRVDVPEHQVALKLLPRSLYASRNVERELVMLATVGHPHVVQLKDHGTTADYVWLTMPVYQGETLAQRLERGPLGLREAYDIFLPMARGLEALHAAGLRHQDVKPDNIFLATFAGRLHPILLDLGVAAERDATFCAGTALFASPEQLRAMNGFPGAVPLNEKMDTYCLAATLLCALVGPEHFPGETATDRAELAEAHELRAQKPLGDNVLPGLAGRPREMIQEALRRWLALEANDRPSMAEMAEQLDVLLEPEREAAREEERARARQKLSLLRVRLAAGALLLVGCAGALVLFLKRETLQLASELERARQLGAESFDKLDTCVASHQLAQSDAASCRDARAKDQAEFKQTLSAIDKNGASEIKSLQALHAARLEACEDDAAAAAKAALAERERLVTGWDKERAALVAERDAGRTLADQRGAELAALVQQRDACDAERQSCITARDRCQAGLADPAVSPANHGGHASPAAQPSSAPSASPAATSSPATPPAPTSEGGEPYAP